MQFRDRITLHKRAGEDEDDTGNEIPTYSDQDMSKATVWSNGSSETVQPADVATGTLSVDFEGWPDITALDEITAWGHRYAIAGDPIRYRSPFSGRRRTELRLLRRT